MRLQPFGLTLEPLTLGPILATASTTTASTVAAMIESRMAPRTLRTKSTTISTSPSAKTSTGHPSRDPVAPSCTGTVVFAASGIRRTNPASTRPMRAMNRPMPTLIAVLSWAGTAWKTALRKPVSTSTRITRPSSTTSPIASCQDMPEAIEKPTKAFSPRPVASASG